MSATDELCRMLDERGVEYTQTIVTGGILFLVITSEEHYYILVRDNDAGLEIWSRYLTPAQAIAATLGCGECHDEGTFRSWGYFTCSNCKVVVPVEAVREAPSIGKVVPISSRPNCGRKVVDK